MHAQFQTLQKVDQLILPMPYNQLLKLFQLSWTYSLPFVIVDEVGWWTPAVMFLISTAFFGLDQLGVMLEQPFGIDAVRCGDGHRIIDPALRTLCGILV